MHIKHSNSSSQIRRLSDAVYPSALARLCAQALRAKVPSVKHGLTGTKARKTSVRAGVSALAALSLLGSSLIGAPSAGAASLTNGAMRLSNSGIRPLISCRIVVFFCNRKVYIPVFLNPSAPLITSVLPNNLSYTPGETVELLGTRFGSRSFLSARSYVSFNDGGSRWGPPGDPPVDVQTWANNAITFVIPSSAPIGTVTVSVVSNSLAGGTVDLSIVPPPPSPEPPVISSLSVSQAPPGTTVVVTGQDFGAQQQGGYLHLSDNGVNWGQPGDVAPFDVVSWHDNQIVFVVPQASNGYSTTPDTTASVLVTNAAGLTSNAENLLITTGVTWPISSDSGDTQIGSSGNGHMDTSVTVEQDGSFTATTQIWDTSGWGIFTGFHGATVITLYGPNGVKLDQWFNGPLGVSGGQGYAVSWSGTLSTDDLAAAYSISVVNFYDPQWTALGNILTWVEQNGPAIAAAAVQIAGAIG